MFSRYCLYSTKCIRRYIQVLNKLHVHRTPELYFLYFMHAQIKCSQCIVCTQQNACERTCTFTCTQQIACNPECMCTYMYIYMYSTYCMYSGLQSHVLCTSYEHNNVINKLYVVLNKMHVHVHVHLHVLNKLHVLRTPESWLRRIFSATCAKNVPTTDNEVEWPFGGQ